MKSNFKTILVEGPIVSEIFHKQASIISKEYSIFKIKSVCKYINKTDQKVFHNEEFFTVIALGLLGNNCYKYLKEGSRVLISGFLNKQSFNSFNIDIEAKEVNFLLPSK